MPTLRVSMLGTPYALDCADADLAGELSRLLAAFPAPGGGEPERLPVLSGADIGTILAELNAAALATADCLAVHAGVVAAGGRAIAFPGPSGIGKTTLTTACLVAGLEYGSDEALCLDWITGAVRPYPRPLALAPAAAALAGAPPPARGSAGAPADSADIVLTIADIGARVAAEPLALAHLLLLRRTAPAAPAALHQAPRGAAVAELLRRSFTAHHRPAVAFALAHRVVGAARAWDLDLGDPRHAAALLADLVSRPG